MTDSESRASLSRRAREFVGVGASVGAGCHPCVSHHIKAGTEAGIDAPALLTAITAAQRVTADSSARMAQHARSQLPTAVAGVAAGGTLREATLAALGAAVAANSMPNIERYLTEAAELGLSHDELADAVSVAHEVQANAARIHARRTDKLLETPPPVSQPATAQNQADGCDDTCPCHDDGSSGSGAVPAATKVSDTGEAPFAAQGCADAPGGADEPPTGDRQQAPPADAGAVRSSVTGCVPPQAMLAGCCGGLSA